MRLNITSEGTAPIDWEHSDLGDGTRSGQTVTWSGADLVLGGLIPAGQRETIDLSLRIVSELGTLKDTFTINAVTVVGQIAGVTTNRELQSTPITVSLNSDVVLSASSHYYLGGAVVGTGPIPPEVGSETGYRIVWNIENSVHALDQVLVSATLPPGITYVGGRQTELGVLTFDESSRTLSWDIERIPTTVTELEAAFDVAVTPNETQIGTFVKLVNESTLTATDSATGARIQASGPSLTTDTGDDEAAGLGVVVE